MLQKNRTSFGILHKRHRVSVKTLRKSKIYYLRKCPLTSDFTHGLRSPERFVRLLKFTQEKNRTKLAIGTGARGGGGGTYGFSLDNR
jgi:hypothetical protein